MNYLEKIFYQAGQECTAAIFSLFEEKSDVVLLDCGCGDGGFTKQIIDTIGGYKEVHGIEVVKKYWKKAIEKGIIIHQDDLNNNISLENESVDVVFSNQVIEHLYNTDKFICEIYRVLKSKGYAVISTENLSSWHNIFALILGWQPFSLSNISSLQPAVGNPLSLIRKKENSSFSGGIPKFMQHTRVFAPKGLKEVFEIHGFKCEKFLGAGYYPLPGSLARFMAKIDTRHTAFSVIKIRKPNHFSY